MIRRIPINMNQRDALLCVNPEAPIYGHRGYWFYVPESATPPGCVKVDDVVAFVCLGGALEVGRVTALLNPDDYPKYCSRLNDCGFRWESFSGLEAEGYRLADDVTSRAFVTANEFWDKAEWENAELLDGWQGIYEPMKG